MLQYILREKIVCFQKLYSMYVSFNTILCILFQKLAMYT